MSGLSPEQYEEKQRLVQLIREKEKRISLLKTEMANNEMSNDSYYISGRKNRHDIELEGLTSNLIHLKDLYRAIK